MIKKAVRTVISGSMPLFWCAVIAVSLSTVLTISMPRVSWAAGAPCECTDLEHTNMCGQADCDGAEVVLDQNHERGEVMILKFIQEEFNAYRDWLTHNDTRERGVHISFFRGYFLPELMQMAEQMSAVAMQQAFIIGTIFDAKHQLETQRTFQTLQAEAHEDYQPSESFCWIGTGARSLAHSEQRGRLNAQALNALQKTRHLGSTMFPSAGMAGSGDRAHDRKARWREFIRTYCDPQDNNYQGGSTGLGAACGAGGARINRDIDFTQTIEHPRTLAVNFTNSAMGNFDEQDVFALSSNLYGHDVLSRKLDETFIQKDELSELYLALRSVAAKRAVAENSYNAIVGLKTSGTADVGEPGKQTRNFLGAIIRELGVTGSSEIYTLIGENPSYYAQLETLTKGIFQNTDFYTNLYDTPANVARKEVALKALGLMLDRAIYESEVRQELATSVLLSTQLHEGQFRDVTEKITNLSGE